MTLPRNISRRTFLRTSTTLAAAAPFILPSRVWGAAVPPNERIALGFIGMGKQNRGLLGGFLRSPELQVLAVCDVDTTRREAARKTVEDHYSKQTASTYKGCRAYNDFRELLARRDIDAVVIATPDHWHAYISIAAANARKDIYCEKPLCQSIREARAMVRAVRRNQRVFQTGSMQRSSKEFLLACELVRNGRLGKLSHIDVAVGGPGVPCDLPGEAPEPGLDWNLWLGPAPERPYNSVLSPRGVHDHFPNWRNYREYGGGMVTDWGAHHFDIAQWALGMDDSGPVEILPAPEPNAKSGVRFRYANGVEVRHVSGNGVTFYGSAGKIYVNRGKFESTPEALGKEPLGAGATRLYASTDHKADWIQAMRKRTRPICDVEVGARTVSVCHLVNLAYYHGQRLQWDPARERFTGGTGNREWLNVPHRSPWKVS